MVNLLGQDHHLQILPNAVALQRLRLSEPHHILDFPDELAIDLDQLRHATNAKDLHDPTHLVPLPDSRRSNLLGRYPMTPPRSHSTRLFPATMSHSTRHWRPCQRPQLDDRNLFSQFAPMDSSMGFARSPHYETSPCSSPAVSPALALLTLLFLLHILPNHHHSTNSSMTPYPKGPSLPRKNQKPPQARIATSSADCHQWQAPGSKPAPLPVKSSGGSSKKQRTPFLPGGTVTEAKRLSTAARYMP